MNSNVIQLYKRLTKNSCDKVIDQAISSLSYQTSLAFVLGNNGSGIGIDSNKEKEILLFVVRYGAFDVPGY